MNGRGTMPRTRGRIHQPPTLTCRVSRERASRLDEPLGRPSLPALVPGIVVLLSVLLAADRPLAADRLRLTFDEEPVPYRIGTEGHTDRWAYYVTRGVSPIPLTNERQIRRHLDWDVAEDRAACALNTRGNFVGIVRRVPDSFARATRIRWRWQVMEDTPRGRFGRRPDDQALQVILIFKRCQPEEYMAISFAWTRKPDRDAVLYTTRLPQDNFPLVQVSVHRRRSGALSEQQENVDIRAAFQAAVRLHGDEFTAAGGDMPELFGIVLYGESSNQRPPVDPTRMSTRAVVRDIVLEK